MAKITGQEGGKTKPLMLLTESQSLRRKTLYIDEKVDEMPRIVLGTLGD